jgi:tripartite-type tricarboxylate transporter receptor subunit TctC
VKILTRSAAIVLALAAMLAPLSAADYPTRPVRLIVGFGPGSAADVMARLLAAKLGQALGEQFVVEGKTGAASNLATEFVVRAPADGYTLLMGSAANAINTTLYPNLSFDFAKDLAPIALIGSVPNLLVVNPALGAATVQELIAIAKAKPEQIHFATSGVGTLSHLSGELLNVMAGIKLVHVPYQGSAQAMTDLLAGRIMVMFAPITTVWSQVEAGKLKALATTRSERSAVAPEVPTMAEAGLAGYDSGIWYGILAPAGTPRDIVERLARATNEAVKASDTLSLMGKQGIDPLGGSSEAFSRYIGAETTKWADVIGAAGLKK